MKHLIISGYNSFIGNNFYNRYKKKYKITYYKDDINKISKIKLLTKKHKFDFFLHFASLSRTKCDANQNQCKKTNFLAINKIINHFNTLKYKPNFIFMSSSHVYANSSNKIKEGCKKKPMSLYAKLKLDSENYIKKNYENYTILRLFNVYGSNQPLGYFLSDMSKKIKKKQIITIDKSIRDFVHVNTVSRIINFIVSKKIIGTINVGSGNGQSLKSIIKKIGLKHKIEPLVKVLPAKTNLVADLKFLEFNGFKFKKNEKNFNI